MSGWYLDNTKIIVTSESEDDKGTVARLNPLSGGTIHHYWGWEESIIKIQAYVVGVADRDAIRGMLRDGNRHYFVGSGFANADFNWTYSGWIASATWKLTLNRFQTIRPDLDCSAPVFDMDIEFYREE